jgi:hypothetical protein
MKVLTLSSKDIALNIQMCERGSHGLVYAASCMVISFTHLCYPHSLDTVRVNIILSLLFKIGYPRVMLVLFNFGFLQIIFR